MKVASGARRLGRVSPTERHTDAFRQALYDAAMTKRTYAALRRHATRLLRRGRAVVLDATYGVRGAR